MSKDEAASPMTRRATPYAMLMPALLVTAGVVLLPVLYTVVMSFRDFVLFRPNQAPFVGLANYARALGDETFWISLRQSLVWIVAVVGSQFALGFVAALLLNRSFIGRGIARALVIVPWALPSVIIGLMWTWMLDFNLGLANDTLLWLGLIRRPIAWLADPDLALWCVVLTLTWQGFPFFAVVILAGLQAIPKELYEAAAIDGAGPRQAFRFVTLPGLREVIATALLLRVIWVANSLDVILVMTGGGPGLATHTLPLYAFLNATTALDYGYGSALAVLLTLMLLGVVIAYVTRAGSETR